MKLDNNPVSSEQRQKAELVHFSFAGYDNENEAPTPEKYSPLSQEKWSKQPQQQQSRVYDEKPPQNQPHRPSFGEEKVNKVRNSSRSREVSAPTE